MKISRYATLNLGDQTIRNQQMEYWADLIIHTIDTVHRSAYKSYLHLLCHVTTDITMI